MMGKLKSRNEVVEFEQSSFPVPAGCKAFQLVNKVLFTTPVTLETGDYLLIEQEMVYTPAEA